MFDEFVAFQARLQPEAPAILTPTGSRSFAQFDADVNRVAGELQHLSIPPSGTVSVEITETYLQWLFLLGLARLGIASTSAHDTTAAHKLTDQEAGAAAPGTLHVSPDWIKEVLGRPAAQVSRPRPAPDTMGHMLLSSGTTGRRKRIGLTWGIIDAIVRNAAIAYGAPQRGRWLVLTGPHTALGFALPLSCWAHGNALVLGAASDLSPGLLSQLQPTLVALVPSRLQALLSILPDGFAAMPWLRIVTAGGVVPPALVQQALLRLAGEFRSVYGASECGAAAIADGALLMRQPGAAGFAMPGVEIEIVDESGRVSRPGIRGEVRIRSNRVTDRYLDDAEGSAAAFRDGWFYPGDLGCIREDGSLIIEGRLDDLMNLGGDKVLPSLVEQVVLGCVGVADAAAFAVPDASGLDRCWVALVRREGFDEGELARRVRQHLPWLPSLSWVSTAAVPRNEAGKIERGRLRQAVVERNKL